MHREQRLARVGLVGVLILTGCRPSAGGTAPQATAHDLTPQPIGSPTSPTDLHPQVVFGDLSVLPGDEAGTWLVLGMARNDSRDPLEGVVAGVELLDPGGSPIAAATAPVALSILQPSATSPFEVRFIHAGTPGGARAGLESFRYSSEPQVSVSIDAIRPARSSDGTLVSGSLRNRGSVAAQAREVIVVWRDAGHSLSGMAIADVPHARMTEGGSVPWLAEVPDAVPESRFEVFTAVTAVDESLRAPLEPVLEPEWRVTAQGDGFVAGAIRNPGREAVEPEVAIAVLVGGRLVSLGILHSTVPLRQGETLTYGIDQFPGLEASPDPDAVSLEVYLTGRRPDLGAPSPILLQASIQQYEVIGSHVFMQGRVTNPGPDSLTSAMVFVSLRSTTGDLQAARWLDLQPPKPGESAEFFVDVPIAAADDPAMSEYDVRAVGLPVPESSW